MIAMEGLLDRDRRAVVIETLAVGLSTAVLVSLFLVVGFAFSA